MTRVMSLRVHGVHITFFFLSGNTISETSSRLLIEMISVNRNITFVNVENTSLSETAERLVHELCGLHERRKVDVDTKRQRRRQRRELSRWKERRERSVARVHDDERTARQTLRDDWIDTFSTTRLEYERLLLVLQKKEARNRLRKHRQEERWEMEANETDARTLRILEEQAARVLLLSPYEGSARTLVANDQGEERVVLKKAENGNWILQKRSEKARLKREAAQREDFCTHEDHQRATLLEQELACRHSVLSDGAASEEHYLSLLQTRLDNEAAAEWKRKQEELRIEAEKQWKADRECREAQRREADRQREREKETRSEHLKRVRLEREEDRDRNIILDLKHTNAAVAKGRETWLQSERERAKLYATTPVASLVLVPEFQRVHYFGAVASRNLFKEVNLNFDIADEKAWKEVERLVTDGRRQYSGALSEAKRVLKVKALEFAPVLLPHIVHPLPPHTHTKGKNEEHTAEYLKSVETAYANKEGILHYDQGQMQSDNKLPSFDDVRKLKTEILGGTYGVSVNSDATFAGHDKFFVQGECYADGFERSIPKGTSVAAVLSLLRDILYRCTYTEEKYSSRKAKFSLSFDVRTLSETACGPASYISNDDPFSAVTTVSVEAEVVYLLSPMLLSAPQDSLLITYTEGTAFDKCALLSEVQVAKLPKIIPPHIMSCPEETYKDGFLSLKFLNNYTTDDELCLRKYFEDDINLVDGKICLGDKGILVGDIETGAMVTHKDRDEKGEIVSCPHVVLRFTSDLCTPAFVTKLIKRLRYINSSSNPSTLRREIEVTIGTKSLLPSSLTIHIDVLSEDDPTQLELAYPRCFFRPAGPTSVPEVLRQYMRQAEIPLFHNAQLIDPDTFYVHCGSLEVACTSGAGKGDYLTLKEGGGVSMRFDTQMVHYNGVEMAHLTTPCGENLNALKVDFSKTGATSLECVQQILRNIHYRNTNYSPAEGWRGYELTVKLGPSVDLPSERPEPLIPATDQTPYDTLQDKVEVRASNDLFDIGSHWALEYKEGSGAVRLAPFEVCSEQGSFVESYMDGSLLVEIVEGHTPDDILNLRQPSNSKEGDVVFKVRATSDLEPEEKAMLGIVDEQPTESETNVTDESRPTTGPDPAFVEKTETLDEGLNDAAEPGTPEKAEKPAKGFGGFGGVKDRMRLKIQQAITEKREKRESFVEKMRGGMQNMKYFDEKLGKDVSVSDIYHSTKKIGVLIIMQSKLLVRFTAKVNRKEVLGILRLLTYTNKSNDPDVLKKIVRIALRDSGLAATQVIVQIDIQNVDDVTDIVLENSRLRYRPGMRKSALLGCFPIAGMRRAILTDPDTEFFDGGSLAVELIGGGVKGDVLGFLSEEQQILAKAEAEQYAKEQRASVKRKPATGATDEDKDVWDHDLYEGTLALRGKQLFDKSDTLIGTVDYPRAPTAGCSNIKIVLTTNSPQIVSIQILTYILNCVTFATASEKVMPGQRIYLIKVKDCENPVCALLS